MFNVPSGPPYITTAGRTKLHDTYKLSLSATVITVGDSDETNVKSGAINSSTRWAT